MSKVAVVIPCYNEALRLQTEEFILFSKMQPDTIFYFVDDGSTDKTLQKLEALQKDIPDSVRILSMQTNKGKAEAVRQGIMEAAGANEFSHIGYLDADLSASISEWHRLRQIAVDNSYDYIIGSRIKLLDAVIKRSAFRHIVGRFLATLIDSRYKLGIYDTQCGAKCFTTDLARLVSEEPFRTLWFFDVEILLRMRSRQPPAQGAEIPLKAWHDRGHSHIGIGNTAGVLKDLFSLFRHYPVK